MRYDDNDYLAEVVRRRKAFDDTKTRLRKMNDLCIALSGYLKGDGRW